MAEITLNAQMNALYAEYEQILPRATLDKMNRANQELAATGIAGRCLTVGDIAPDFALPDARGRAVELGSLLRKGPVVVSFFRGGWCTFCNLELKALQRHFADIRRAGAFLVAITPQQQAGTLEVVDSMGLEYPVLSDQGNQLARSFGLVFELAEGLRPVYANGFKIDLPKENGDDRFELPITSTFIVGKDRRIVAAFNDPNYFVRMEPRSIVETLERM